MEKENAKLKGSLKLKLLIWILKVKDESNSNLIYMLKV